MTGKNCLNWVSKLKKRTNAENFRTDDGMKFPRKKASFQKEKCQTMLRNAINRTVLEEKCEDFFLPLPPHMRQRERLIENSRYPRVGELSRKILLVDFFSFCIIFFTTFPFLQRILSLEIRRITPRWIRENSADLKQSYILLREGQRYRKSIEYFSSVL